MALKIEWTEEARTDIRALDRSTAMRIFDGLYRYSLTGQGDVNMLQGKHAGKLRLWLGDYRCFFSPQGQILRVLAIKHRSETYQ